MINIADFTYDKNGLNNIKKWGYGQNWPVVYILYNDNTAYVGETLDAVRRTEQHFAEKEFDAFNKICLISGRTYNKSVILDLESFLIKYMSADDNNKKITNGNAGVADHDYFYKEAYKDDFKEIWEELIKRGIVKKTLLDIENSELYKYSPYKSLNLEQQKAAYDILKSLAQMNKSRTASLYMVKGGAGTGKSILAVFIVKLLVDISKDKKVWNTIADSEDALFLQKISGELNGIKKIGFVVPMIELRNTMKSIFNSIDGLTEKMVLAPEEVVKVHYDLLVVDEAHRLYRRKSLPGGHLYNKFDRINRQLMLEDFTKSEEEAYTELHWIIKSSEMQVLFYDEYQTIRVTDIDSKRFNAICTPHLFNYYTLFSQMRCKGGNGYYEYIKDVIEKKGLELSGYKKINNYELKVVDKIEDIFNFINEKNDSDNLCKVVTGPGWGKDEMIEIEGKKYKWASGKNDRHKNVIFSIHKIQGFDLNYVGVVFGKEIYYDDKQKKIVINKKEVKDNCTKSNGDDYMRECILHIYVTLMTRGIDGAYIYAVDDKLREYLKKFLN